MATATAQASTLEQSFLNTIKKGKGTLKWMGVLMVLLGIAAIAYPGLFTLSITLLVGTLFFMGGFFTFMSSFALTGTGPFFGSLLLGLLQMAAGLIVIRQPVMGAWVLTMMIAFVFMLEGAMQMATAFEMRPSRGWGWLAFSAVVSILAGFLVVGAMPGAQVWLIGLLFGVNFLSTGISSIALSSAIPKVES